MAAETKAGTLRIIGEELEALRKRIIANHEAAGQVASGRTKGSLKVEMSEDGGVLWGRQAFAVLETGRGPGKVPKGFYKIIRQWVEDKGIQVKKPDSFAYLVARKIAKEGTELYRNRKHGGSCFFDLSFYTQSYFDEYREVDYKSTHAEDSKLGRLFSIELDMYNESGTLENSFQFNVFILWGASKVGEQYNGSRVLTWFKNYPFSVGLYSATSGNVKVTIDGSESSPIALSGQNAWNIILAGIDASDRVEFYLPGSNTAASVFDHTFDFTFRGLLNMATKITCKVDNSDCGIYLRWINRHGMWCYWLFMQGDETSQVSNDGEFIRNNMQDYSYKNGYHGGSGRKQRKMEETTLPVCAPLIDSITYDFLYQMATSPVVDMFMGYDDNGNARWMAVNVSVGNFVKQRVSLQDFEANIILPETNVQSL